MGVAACCARRHLMVVRGMVDTPAGSAPAGRWPGNTLQNRSVSSPAPVTIVWPSGDVAKYSTLRTGACQERLCARAQTAHVRLKRTHNPAFNPNKKYEYI